MPPNQTADVDLFEGLSARTVLVPFLFLDDGMDPAFFSIRYTSTISVSPLILGSGMAFFKLHDQPSSSNSLNRAFSESCRGFVDIKTRVVKPSLSSGSYFVIFRACSEASVPTSAGNASTL